MRLSRRYPLGWLVPYKKGAPNGRDSWYVRCRFVYEHCESRSVSRDKREEETEDSRGKERGAFNEDLNGSLKPRIVHVSDPASQLFTLQSSAYVPEVSSRFPLNAFSIVNPSRLYPSTS